MSALKKVSSLKFLRFNTAHPGSLVKYCEAGYRLFRSQWESTFKELGVEKSLHSDGYLDRECVGCFNGIECVGLVLLTSYDLSRFSMRDHSYFENYSPQLISDIMGLGHKRVMAYSSLTLDSQWRKGQTDLPITDILVGIGTKEFLASPATALICYTRNDRKVNELFYRFGGRPLAKNIQAYNVQVDFGLAKKSDIVEHPDVAVAQFIQSYWEKTKRQEKGAA